MWLQGRRANAAKASNTDFPAATISATCAGPAPAPLTNSATAAKLSTAKAPAGDLEQGAVTGTDVRTDTQIVVKDAQQAMAVRMTPPPAAAMVGGPGALSDSSSSVGDGVCDFCDDSRPVAALEIPKEVRCCLYCC